MRHNTPKIRVSLKDQRKVENNLPDFISIGSPEWYIWLEQQSSFSFESLYGTLVVRKERRYGNWHWYTYHRIHRKLHIAYLGRTEELTLERLNEAAQALASTNIQAKSASHEIPQRRQPRYITLGIPPLYTKLSIPSIPAKLVARPHLTQRLNETISHKLVLVSAPAGAGKTTLLSEWVQQCNCPISWVSLDEYDNDPVQFWSYIIWALESIHTSIGERVLELLHSSETRPIEAILALLINNLSTIAYDFALVLDDYHTINTQSIHDTLSFLLNHLPSHVHLVISSRNDPPLPIARLRANGELLDIRASNLRFLTHEAKTFLTHTWKLPLSEEMLSALESRTEGWITGLQLLALSLQNQEKQGQEKLDDYIKAFTGSNYYILDYLVEEVLYQQHARLQTFLLYTSILERLCESLCDAVTNQHGSQRYLEVLERFSLFIVPLDQHWYRYHPLFKEALRKHLQNSQSGMLPKLYLQAYTWCAQNGLLVEAILYAITAGAFGQAAQYIIQIGEAMIRNGEVIMLQEWLDKLPEELVRSCSQLCLLQAWLFMVHGQFSAVEEWLQTTESSLDKNSSNEKDAARQNIVGKVAALRAHILALRGDIPATFAQVHQALECLPADNLYLRGLSTLTLGIACWLSDDVFAAERAFIQANVLSQTDGSSYVELMATCALAQVQMVRGERRLAARTSKQALKMVSENSNRFLPIAAYAYVGMGQHFYEWNDLETATRYLQQGIKLSEQWGTRDMLVYGYTELAQVKQAQNDIDGASALLEQAEKCAAAHQQPSWIVGAMKAQQIKLALTQGDSEKIEGWRLQHTKHDYLPIFMQMLNARIYIYQGQFVKALDIVEQQVQIAQSKGQKGMEIELRVLEAIAYQQQQNRASALQALEHALCLAEPEGYIRMFANEGAPMAALLAQVLMTQQQRGNTYSDNILAKYIKKLLMALNELRDAEIKNMMGNELSAICQPPFESLSKREWEIVQLIREGMSNQEIAQQLVIAETTVKWHIRKIFSKLDVRSRSQIIVLSRKL